jgi:hypothetical protein
VTRRGDACARGTQRAQAIQEPGCDAGAGGLGNIMLNSQDARGGQARDGRRQARKMENG